MYFLMLLYAIFELFNDKTGFFQSIYRSQLQIH